MKSTFSLAALSKVLKVGDIDPGTGRAVMAKGIWRSYLLAAQHLLTCFEAVPRSENTVSWQFKSKVPRASSRQICWEKLLIELKHNPVDVGDMYRDVVLVTQDDWMVLVGVLEMFTAINPISTRSIRTRGEADECVTDWVQKTTWDFAPSVEITSGVNRTFAQAVHNAVLQGRIKLARKTGIAGLSHCVRDESDAATAFHTALRKSCDSSPTSAAWNFMRAFTDKDWERFTPRLHTAVRMAAGETSHEAFSAVVAARMKDMDHMAFHDHGYLWKAFCGVLASMNPEDWEAACSYFVAWEVKDAAPLPEGFVLAAAKPGNEGMAG